jgi:hypothetical protein
LLAEAGLKVDKYSRASQPTEIQELVKQGYGFALIREGTVLDTELITRPIRVLTGDTAIVFNKLRHPKTIPVLVRHLKRQLAASTNSSTLHQVVALPHAAKTVGKRPPRSDNADSAQMSLLG